MILSASNIIIYSNTAISYNGVGKIVYAKFQKLKNEKLCGKTIKIVSNFSNFAYTIFVGRSAL